MNYSKSLLISILIIILFSSSSFSLDENQQKIEIEWIHGDEAAKIFALPYYKWLDNNKLIIFDQNKSEEELG